MVVVVALLLVHQDQDHQEQIILVGKLPLMEGPGVTEAKTGEVMHLHQGQEVEVEVVKCLVV